MTPWVRKSGTDFPAVQPKIIQWEPMGLELRAIQGSRTESYWWTNTLLALVFSWDLLMVRKIWNKQTTLLFVSDQDRRNHLERDWWSEGVQSSGSRGVPEDLLSLPETTSNTHWLYTYNITVMFSIAFYSMFNNSLYHWHIFLSFFLSFFTTYDLIFVMVLLYKFLHLKHLSRDNHIVMI